MAIPKVDRLDMDVNIAHVRPGDLLQFGVGESYALVREVWSWESERGGSPVVMLNYAAMLEGMFYPIHVRANTVVHVRRRVEKKP